MALRAFLALDLDGAARQRILDLIDRLRPGFPGVRWVRPDGLHVTMRFLGWTPEAATERIAQALVPAARACAPAEIALGELGMFPERGSPGVLWLGMDLPDDMHALQRACEAEARREGFPPEQRAFKPHLTLGRWKDRVRRPTLPRVDLGSARIDTLTLYRSELRPSGAVYAALSRFDLGR